MRRLSVILLVLLALPSAALAQGENPLEHSVLLADAVGWIMAGLALLLMVLFVLWTRRNPQ